ncbi:MAG: hypothetical protein KGY38_06810 [Desulfobacterales bacterium]|nr:hypothetical protein [Desulfobacterales bacterium]
MFKLGYVFRIHHVFMGLVQLILDPDLAVFHRRIPVGIDFHPDLVSLKPHSLPAGYFLLAHLGLLFIFHKDKIGALPANIVRFAAASFLRADPYPLLLPAAF